MILIFDSYVITQLKTGKDIINIGKKCREGGALKIIISFVSVKNNIKLTKFIS